MKKKYGFIIAALALVSILPFAFADGEVQERPDYIDNGSGICYDKTAYATTDGSGIYWINLESFAKGQGAKIQHYIASDIVLVLDVSGSMKDDFGEDNSYVVTNKAWTYNNLNAENVSYLYNGQYYEVQFDFNQSGNQVRPYIQTGYGYNSRVYFTANGTTINQPNRVALNQVFFNGSLRTRSRMTALQTAVDEFITLIDNNDINDAPTGQDRLGNNISIVTFAADSTTILGLTPLTQATTIRDAVKNLEAGGGTMAHLGMEAAYKILNSKSQNHLKTVVFFTDGNPGQNGSWDNNYDNFWDTPQNGYYITGNETHLYQVTWNSANRTIYYANEIKKLEPEDQEGVDPEDQIFSNVFTVSIINPSSDYTDVYLGKTSSNWLKADKMGSVTITQNGWSYTTTGWNTDIWKNGNGELKGDGKNYALTADSVTELKEAFKEVAGESGGSTLPMTEKSISQVDVVSASFMLPPGMEDPSSIQIYVAKCVGREWKTYKDPKTKEEKSAYFYIFGDEMSKDECDDTFTRKKRDPQTDEELDETETVSVTGNISVTLTSSGTYEPNPDKLDQITVNGFDFGNLYVGPILKQGEVVPEGQEPTDDQIQGWHGYKLIIKIPIEMDTNAVGGPNVDTNGPNSGITYKGQPIVTFESPQVSLPINLFINKNGLREGESARFTIQRASLDDTWPAKDSEDYPKSSTDQRYESLTWTDVSSVFVTHHAGATDASTVTKLKGLPSVDDEGNEVIYRIIEDDWSWSYTPSLPAIFTSDLLVTNPFKFNNQKIQMIDVTVRHAESKVTNTFHNGDFVVEDQTYKEVSENHRAWDDSKPNDR